AADVLTELGAEAALVRGERGIELRGCSCPVSVAVSERPEVCRAVETLLSDLTGSEVRERCDRSERPRCHFEFIDRKLEAWSWCPPGTHVRHPPAKARSTHGPTWSVFVRQRRSSTASRTTSR